MSALLCPRCAKAEPQFLGDVSRESRLNYYRCATCAYVWARLKLAARQAASPNKPQDRALRPLVSVPIACPKCDADLVVQLEEWRPGSRFQPSALACPTCQQTTAMSFPSILIGVRRRDAVSAKSVVMGRQPRVEEVPAQG
jgi:ssDNA-binding Zn-finger/Zn-ribbon topoisomerase 1